MELEKSCRYAGNSGDVIGLQDRFLTWMYGHRVGCILIRLMIHPVFSKLGGAVLGSRLSAVAVPLFAKKNHIDLSDCEKRRFSSFNDFFARKLRTDAREVLQEEMFLTAPCDARLSVYPIRENGLFPVKNTMYTLQSLLKNEVLAEKYQGGTLWLYRLCVDDYHRYIYPETGRKSKQVHIDGVFHTVNPAANDVYPIYKENTREYCLIQTAHSGTVLMMEVGAMLVGKIENRHPSEKNVIRGEEKGNFAFGGSTIIVLTQKNRGIPLEHLRQNTKKGIETRVKMGEMVGCY